MNLLHASFTREVAAEGMPSAVAAQVTLLARFYERLGDHAVNLGGESSSCTTPILGWGPARPPCLSSAAAR